MGVRLSLGAGRPRLVRQLLTESALLAIPAAVLGFIISESTIRMGERLMFATLPHEFAQYITVLPLDPDLRVLAFMLLAAIASVLLFGLAPALQMTRSNIMQAARGEFTTEIRPSRLRNALVVIQVATCMPLLICAGVLVRAESKFAKQDIGLNIRNVLAIQIEDKARPRALARLTDTRSLESLAAATEIPLDHRLPTIPVKPAKGDHQIRAFYNSVSPSYFALFNIPLRSGRLFTDNEARNASPVAVVSSRTAYRFWPKQNPIGQTLQLLPNSSMSSTNRFARLRTVRVLGVVGDVLSGWIGDGPETTCIYFPTTVHAEGTALLARVHGNIMTAQQRLDAALNEVAPGEIDEIHPLEEILNVQLYPFRAAYWVGSSLGTLALLLTVIGIYGVLSFTVAQRTKEIGVRTALGAKPLTLVSMVFAQSLRLMGMGIGVGVAIAISVSTVFASFFTSISTYDPLSYAGGIGIIVLATGFAAYFPCRRATRISPLIALRYE
jgi:predicted permease